LASRRAPSSPRGDCFGAMVASISRTSKLDYRRRMAQQGQSTWAANLVCVAGKPHTTASAALITFAMVDCCPILVVPCRPLRLSGQGPRSRTRRRRESEAEKEWGKLAGRKPQPIRLTIKSGVIGRTVKKMKPRPSWTGKKITGCFYRERRTVASVPLASELAEVTVPIPTAVVRAFTNTRSRKLKFMNAAADSAQ